MDEPSIFCFKWRLPYRDSQVPLPVRSLQLNQINYSSINSNKIKQAIGGRAVDSPAECRIRESPGGALVTVTVAVGPEWAAGGPSCLVSRISSANGGLGGRLEGVLREAWDRGSCGSAGRICRRAAARRGRRVRRPIPKRWCGSRNRWCGSRNRWFGSRRYRWSASRRRREARAHHAQQLDVQFAALEVVRAEVCVECVEVDARTIFVGAGKPVASPRAVIARLASSIGPRCNFRSTHTRRLIQNSSRGYGARVDAVLAHHECSSRYPPATRVKFAGAARRPDRAESYRRSLHVKQTHKCPTSCPARAWRSHIFVGPGVGDGVGLHKHPATHMLALTR